MRKGQTLTATDRAERSRATTRHVMARELMYAGILARLWPQEAYLTTSRLPSDMFPSLLCVTTPAGPLVWRISTDEEPFFDWLPRRSRTNEAATDRLPVLQNLAANGW